MQVTAICNPLQGLTASRVEKIVRKNWQQVRQSEADQLHTAYFSHGYNALGVGSGVAAALAQLDTAFASYTLLDASEFASWETGVRQASESGGAIPLESSFPIGDALRKVVESGVKKIHLHLPRFSAFSDLGCGFLAAFDPENLPTSTALDLAPEEQVNLRAGESLPQKFFPQGNETTIKLHSELPDLLRSQRLAQNFAECTDQILARRIENFRRLLAGISLRITYSDPQQLLGFSGIAKTWTNYGVSVIAAQEVERSFGAFIARFEKAVGVRTLLQAPKETPFAGVGGGLGFLLNSFGYPLWSIADYFLSDENFFSKMQDQIAHSDLVFYICEKIGEEVPRGLVRFSEIAQEFGVPFVLISEKSGFRKSDFPRFSLAGSYDLWSGDVANSSPQYSDLSGDLARDSKGVGKQQELRLAAQIRRCATTWGW